MEELEFHLEVYGSVNEDGYVDDKSYKLLTWDLVSSPSNIPSWVNGIYEAKEWIVSDTGIITEQLTLTEEEQLEAKKEALYELNATLTPELIHLLSEDNNITLEDSKKIYGEIIKKYLDTIVERL